ncbi:MAG: peroxiredoxin family protein [Candidatus Synoicihabitans palmerolidicus]|nr:peroxiredoxin family protein [Candidatus Synoicihabitans palmerolidicus]
MVTSLGAAEESMPGLKVGDHAPEFTLPSTLGGEVSLAALREDGPVALVFVRSADWCPYCRRQLVDLQEALSVIEASGGRIVAVSYDELEINTAAVAKLGLTYPLLSDEGSKAIDAYGIRNMEAKRKGVGIPYPTVFVIDASGVIRVKLARDGYKERPESVEIISGVCGTLV